MGAVVVGVVRAVVVGVVRGRLAAGLAHEILREIATRRETTVRPDPGGPEPSADLMTMGTLAELLDGYRPDGEAEVADLRRIRELTEGADDPWARSLLPLHVTASALVVHPPSGRVLLRWHQRQQAWLQVGGHGDPGESDALAIALREAREETGLADLVAWPDAGLCHVVVVPVPATGDEPAHEHADLRFVFATSTPGLAVAETMAAPLRWLTMDEAHGATSEANLRETLARAGLLLARGDRAGR